MAGLPPKRQRSFSRPFPTLSLLAIYSSTPVKSLQPVAGRQDDATVEASKILFFSAQEELTVERKARLMGTVMGMADFAKMLTPGGGPSVRAVHSTKQRMVWLEPERGFFVHASIDLPSTPRHSRGPSSATTASNSSVGSEGAAQLEDEALLAALEEAYRAFRLLHGSFERLSEQGREAMVESLQEYWEAWTKGWNVSNEGSFERILGALPRSPLVTAVTASQIAPLVAQFSASNPSTLPILMHGNAVLSLPSLPSKSLSPVATAPQTPDSASIASSRTPRSPPPPMTEIDLLALVQHLQKTMVRPSSISVKPQPPPLHSTKEAEASVSSDQTSRWATYTLGMSSYLSSPSMPAMPTMPTIPSMPAMPMPSLPSLAMPSLPSIPGLSSTPPTSSTSPPSTVSGWRFHKPGWGGTLGLGHKRTGSKASSVKSAEASRPSTPAPADSSASSSYPPPAAQQSEPAPVASADPRPSTPSTPTTEGVLPGPATPTVDLAPDVDTFALAEAMGSLAVDGAEPARTALEEAEGGVIGERKPSEASEVEEREEASEEKVEADEEESVVEQERVLKVYCGEKEKRDTEIEVRTFERGALTLAFASLPIAHVDTAHWLASRSHRLLEAVETILELVMPSPPDYPHRHLRKEGQLSTSHAWPSKEDSWSGKSSSNENEINSALFDCVRHFSSHPPILESFVRVSSSQWVVGRRSEELAGLAAASPATTLTDVFVILPAKVGRDGSLVDAAEELRRFDRVFS